MSMAAETAGSQAVEILVVDDSSFNRLLLRRRLAELGYERVTMANNGVEAMEAMAARTFDAVLLDLEMPELDGIGVLERLRASGRQEPPVIVISALSDLAGVVRCIELGAEDYLPKSFDPPLLRARLSAVLEKKRLRDLAAQRLAALETELESARQAQLSLVPTEFAAIGSDRLALHGLMIPAKQVGGDLYDAMRLDERHLLFGVGDVSGKGAPAALTMARAVGVIRSAGRALAAAAGGAMPDPAAILSVVNDELAENNEKMTFLTAVLGIVDTTTGLGRIAVAGHDAPIVMEPGAPPRLLPLSLRQPALGMMEGVRYRSEPLALTPGQALLLYTDGITEAMDGAGTLYGRERAMARLAQPGTSTDPARLIGALIEDIERFVGGADQGDDITALALRFS